MKDVVNRLGKLVDMFGVVSLLDRNFTSHIVSSHDFSNTNETDKLCKEIKSRVIKLNSNLVLDKKTVKEINTIKKNILEVYMKYKKTEPLSDFENEAIKHYLIEKDNLLSSLRPDNTLNEDVQVYSEAGRYFIYKSENRKIKKIPVTNFLLYPHSIVIVENKDIRKSLYKFEAVSAMDGKTRTIILTPEDMASMAEFQKAVFRQANVIKPQIHDLQSHMRGMAYELTESAWKDLPHTEKIGTTVLGYERFSDMGEKYMCTPEGVVYKQDGVVAEDVVFVDPSIRIPGDNFVAADKYGNMDYTLEEWKNTARFLLERVMKLNKKDVMANIAGWFFANTQEYNIREINREYPLLHVAGPKSSGKSLTISSIKSYFGHADDSLEHFPTPPVFVQDLTLSYTLPAIYDEYGGSDKNQGWSDFTFNEMHRIMKHVFDKSILKKAGKGEGGQGRFVYKIRNSLCSMGQTYIRDASIASRTTQVNIDGSIKGTAAGDLSLVVADELKNYNNKSFITGYTLWCMQQDDSYVQEQVRYYKNSNRRRVRELGLKYDERQQQNTSAIQTGLHLARKLALELGVDIGYDEEYIEDLVVKNAEISDRLFEKTTDDALLAFLRDVSVHMKKYGNAHSSSVIYGPSGLVTYGKGPSSEACGQYGRTQKRDACIYDHDYVAIKLKDMIAIVNADMQKRGKDAHDFASIQPYIESYFNKACNTKGDGLVIAPENYRYARREKGSRYQGWYTLFNMSVLSETVSEDFSSNSFWNVETSTDAGINIISI